MIELQPASKKLIVSLIGEPICRILQNVGPLVPAIPAVATAALMLAEAVQTAEKNKEDFRKLGRSSCLIMATLVRKIRPENESEHEGLNEDAAQLHEAMRFIQECVTNYGRKQSFWKRIRRHSAYKRAIEECEGRLQSALAMFSLSSDIELRQQVDAFLKGEARTLPQFEGPQEVEDGPGNVGQSNRTEINVDNGTIGFSGPDGDCVGNINLSRGPLDANGQDEAHQTPHSNRHLARPEHPPNSTLAPQRSRTIPLPRVPMTDNHTTITGRGTMVGASMPGGILRGNINLNIRGY